MAWKLHHIELRGQSLDCAPLKIMNTHIYKVSLKRRFFRPGSAIVPLALALATILFGGTSALCGGNNMTASTSANIARKVTVQATITPLFSLGVACKSSFNMNGNNCAVDSYNSSLTNASTGGQYDVNKRLAGGDVGVDGAVVGDVNLGNGNIYGHLFTGAGSVASQVQIGNNGAVGDAGWNSGSSGIQPGAWSPTFNASFPDVPAPSPIGLPLPLAIGGVINLLPGVNYVTTTSPAGVLYATGPSQVWIQGSASIGVNIGTNGGSLVLYVGKASGSGDSLTLSGNGTMNQPGLPRNLQIYGLPSLTSVDMHGNAGFNATLYAPEANFIGGGGGNNTQDTSGSITVNSISLNGHWHFHYDESLKSFGPNRGWIAKNWTEVKYP
jgi:hypothetical protein